MHQLVGPVRGCGRGATCFCLSTAGQGRPELIPPGLVHARGFARRALVACREWAMLELVGESGTRARRRVL